MEVDDGGITIAKASVNLYLHLHSSLSPTLSYLYPSFSSVVASLLPYSASVHAANLGTAVLHQ